MAAAAGVMLVLAGAWQAGNRMTAPTNAAVADFGPSVESVTIDSAPGIRLKGSYWPGRGPAILLLHGNGGHRGDVAGTAEWLNGQGYRVLVIDFRGHGESTPAPKSFGLDEAADAAAAFAWLKQKAPGKRIGVIGFSLGGAAALLGEGGPLPADALVLESVYPDIRSAIFNRIAMHAGRFPAYAGEPLLSLQSLPRYGVWPSRIAPIDALRRIKAPVMIVSGGEDAYTPPAEAEAMFDAAGRKGELWILGGLSHDEVVAASSPEFRARLLAFLARHLEPGNAEAAES